MASDVDICNLALSHLGDDATVASIDPPEGSAQAAQCARFYPMARDKLLDAHNWFFCTVRDTLARLSTDPAFGWTYAYGLPADPVRIIGVYAPGGADDQPQEFETESLADGTYVIYTDVEDAVVRYVARGTDAAKYPAPFVEALSRLLASYLAGPIIKGDAGRKAANEQYGIYRTLSLPDAKKSDTSQRRVRPEHTPTWIEGR